VGSEASLRTMLASASSSLAFLAAWATSFSCREALSDHRGQVFPGVGAPPCP
jgi:hypothetical protein